MLNIRVDRIGEHIKALKRDLRAKLPDLKKVMAEVEDFTRREVDEIASARAAGRNIVPVLDFKDVETGNVSDATKNEVRRRGVAVVRGVYPNSQAVAWNDEVGEYLAMNRYTDRPPPQAKDEYFSKLKSGKPQIFGIYWSKPQMMA